MLRIVSFLIYNLKKNSLIEYLHTFIEKAEACPTVTAGMAKWLTSLKTAFAEAERVYHISLKSPITELIRLVDGQRDGIVTGMKAIVNAFQKSENPAEREAARLLWTGLSSLKHNTNDQYAEQTGQVDNLLYFLTVTEAASVETLRLGTLVGQLREVNERMHALIEGRVEEIQNRELGAFEKARAAAEEEYRQFVLTVNSFARINEEQLDAGSDAATGKISLAEFITWANANIEFYDRKVLKQPAAGVEEDVEDAEGEEDSGADDGGNGGNSGNGGTSEPTTPTEPTTPPSSEPVYSVARFTKFNGETEEIRQLVGSILHAPANTEGYRWVPAVPSTMPAVNTSYSEEAVGAVKYTVAWYLPNGNPIIWYELAPGETIPEAPEPPEGYYWHPYPDVMPEHDLDIIPEPIRG